ncbi:MAG TPA: serine/threonine-protein kinase [Polyangiaceae bacterium]|nr:serine/threonine-protein kinase [Polyangiaceae bacterium]
MNEQRYQVIERIAAGGMAEVYRGESAGVEGFRKKVAIKRVLPQLSANREFINMFLDEARLCAYLSHSKCVQVFDIGQGGGSHFIVMEFVDGADLQGVLEFLNARNQRMPVEAACFIALGICEGLAYAHQARDHHGNPLNIVHRDISPHNVLMTKYGEVKLVDFGLAKASSHLVEEDEDIVKGKFGYLAPEVTLGQGADHRVDIFAAGILLWEMLAGRRLFRGDTDVDTFKLVRATLIPDIREIRPEVTDQIWTVVQKALARDPKDRYLSADDFARDLSRVLIAADRPVSYLDLGKMVREAAGERDRKRKSEGKAGASFMGDLILDTLHEFSGHGSIPPPPAAQGALGTRGVNAGGSDFVDPSAWGLDSLFDEPAKPQPPPKPVARPAEAAPAAPARAPAPAPAQPAASPAAAPARPPAAAPAPAGPPATPAAGPPAAAQETPAQQAQSAAERARGGAAPKKEGNFWKKWFG